MRPHRPLIIATASALVLLVFAVGAPGLVDDPEVWYGVGAVYALTLALVAGAWHRLGRPPEFAETTAIAAVVVAGVVPLTAFLFQDTSMLSLGDLVPYLLQWLFPAAFMLPLGAAVTRRQRLGTVGVVFLLAVYVWVYSTFLAPGFSSISPLSAAVLQVWWTLSSAAVGAPLLLIGYDLARGDGFLLDAARRLGAFGTG